MYPKIHPPRPSRFPLCGDFAPLGPRDCPRAISRASGCKIPALGKSLRPRGVYFPIHPSFRQCTDSIQSEVVVFQKICQVHLELRTCTVTLLCDFAITFKCWKKTTGELFSGWANFGGCYMQPSPKWRHHKGSVKQWFLMPEGRISNSPTRVIIQQNTKWKLQNTG